jgi:hypothetical protein
LRNALLRSIAISILILLQLQLAWGFRLLELFPPSNIFVLLMLVPSQVWDIWWADFYRSGVGKVKVFYDSECGVCQFIVRLVMSFLLSRDAEMKPNSEGGPDILNAMELHRSWIVRDSKGVLHSRSGAFRAICLASPILRPFTLGMPESLWTKIGEPIYSFGSKRRNLGSFLIPNYDQRGASNIKTGIPSKIIVSALLLYSLIDFGAALGWVQWPTWAEAVPKIGSALNIRNRWFLFVEPFRDDEWFKFEGIERNGNKINLMTGNPIGPKDICSIENRPSPIVSIYPSYREWTIYKELFYTGQMLLEDTPHLRKRFAENFCLNWNREHIAADRIQQVDLAFMFQYRLENGNLTRPVCMAPERHPCPEQQP